MNHKSADLERKLTDLGVHNVGERNSCTDLFLRRLILYLFLRCSAESQVDCWHFVGEPYTLVGTKKLKAVLEHSLRLDA